jgi:hypothetical protein
MKTGAPEQESRSRNIMKKQPKHEIENRTAKK